MKRRTFSVAAILSLLLFATEAGADRGIGGTYVPPPPRPTPGSTTKPLGTTIIGTIVKFGSVHVNDVVLDVPDMKGLALGQTVRLYAPSPIAQRMTAERVDRLPALTGPVDAAYAKGMLTVLGRTIAIDRGTFVEDGLQLDAAAPGTMLTVFGLAKADGSLLATRIERAAANAPGFVRGRLAPARDGSLAVHGVRVAARVQPDWIGRVVTATVDVAKRVASTVELEDPLSDGVAAELSLEGIVGSDIRPDAITIDGTTVPMDRNTLVRDASLLRADQRVVVELTRAPDGHFRAARIEAPPAERTQPALPTLPPDLPFTLPPNVPPPSTLGPSSLPSFTGPSKK